MDFLVGILLAAVIILLLYNFTSISVSSSSMGSGTSNAQNYLIPSMQQNNMGMNIFQPVVPNYSINANAPVSQQAASNKYIYDYHKYFFIS